MTFLVIIAIGVLSLLSTSIMSYVSLATPIGPWISPTLVLILMLFMRLFAQKVNSNSVIAYTTAGGSVGGILATACGFSFPTLYFLNPSLFNSWLSQPFYFCAILFSLSWAAGLLAFLVANVLEEKYALVENMPFPIGQLVYEMIAAQDQVYKAYELALGFASTTVVSVLQGGFGSMRSIMPRVMTLMGSVQRYPFSIPSIQLRLDMLPMLLAIGFITGHVIALPLAVGACAKIFIADVFNTVWFPSIKEVDFLLAFCSGIVLVGALQSFLDMPQLVAQLYSTLKKNYSTSYSQGVFSRWYSMINATEAIIALIFIVSFLTYFGFSPFYQSYLIVGAIICTYQIVIIAGKIGMAQLGRFATFVMAPGILIFGIDGVKLTIVATFVEICGGVATDLLFNRKMGSMIGVDKSLFRKYQLLGLFLSSLMVGIVFWLLINRFGLGSENLFAQRAQARALLINVSNFNVYVLLLGVLFGFIVKKIKINPMLVLGGILMPLSYSLGLMLGGFLAYCFSDRQRWEPFWSGVFAANSLLELIKTII